MAMAKKMDKEDKISVVLEKYPKSYAGILDKN